MITPVQIENDKASFCKINPERYSGPEWEFCHEKLHKYILEVERLNSKIQDLDEAKCKNINVTLRMRYNQKTGEGVALIDRDPL